MTAKEKAAKLVQKFYDEITNHMTWEESKECALICVNEILNMPNAKFINPDYWIEVKKEIELL